MEPKEFHGNCKTYCRRQLDVTTMLFHPGMYGGFGQSDAAFQAVCKQQIQESARTKAQQVQIAKSQRGSMKSTKSKRMSQREYAQPYDETPIVAGEVVTPPMGYAYGVIVDALVVEDPAVLAVPVGEPFQVVDAQVVGFDPSEIQTGIIIAPEVGSEPEGGDPIPMAIPVEGAWQSQVGEVVEDEGGEDDTEVIAAINV